MGPPTDAHPRSDEHADLPATPSQVALRVFDSPLVWAGADATVAPFERYRRTSVDPGPLFGLLDNPSCRKLLAVADDEPLTASEFDARSDVPLSTIYRHLDPLTELGLLEESLRFEANGRFPSQYTRSVDHIHIDLRGDQISVDVW